MLFALDDWCGRHTFGAVAFGFVGVLVLAPTVAIAIDRGLIWLAGFVS